MKNMELKTMSSIQVTQPYHGIQYNNIVSQTANNTKLGMLGSYTEYRSWKALNALVCIDLLNSEADLVNLLWIIFVMLGAVTRKTAQEANRIFGHLLQLCTHILMTVLTTPTRVTPCANF